MTSSIRSQILLLFLLFGQMLLAQDIPDFSSFRPKLMQPLGHTHSINKVLFSPDGKIALTGGLDGAVKMWESKTGKLLLDLSSHSGSIRDVQFSLDGKHIITASSDKTAKIWDAETGKELLTLTNHSGWLNTAQFSIDGDRIVTSSFDNTVKVWDAISGEELFTLIGYTAGILTAEFSPDGKKILTASQDGTVKVWDALTGRLILDLIGRGSAVRSAKYSPDGERIVAIIDDRTTKVWDAKTGKELFTFKGHFYYATYFEFSPDSKTIVTTSPDQTAKVWSIETGKLVLDLIHHKGVMESIKVDTIYFEAIMPKGAVNYASFSPDGRSIVTACSDGNAKVWDVQSGKIVRELIGHKGQIFSSSYSPDGRFIITGSADKTAKIWDAETGNLLQDLKGYNSKIEIAHYSPDGKEILIVGKRHKLKVWDSRTGKLIRDFGIGHSARVNSAHFSPDEKHLVTASQDQTMKVWDLHTGDLIHDMEFTNSLKFAQYNPNGTQIITTCYKDSIVHLIDAVTGELLHNLKGHKYVINDLEFALDGKQIVTASHDSTAKVWDAQTGKLIHDLIGHKEPVNSAQYSPDGRYIVTTSFRDSTCKVWNAQTGNMIFNLVHTGHISSARFSPDGKQILTSMGDVTAVVWDAQTGKKLHNFKHTGNVSSARFSPDGKQVVTASLDKTAKMWDAQTGTLLHTFISESEVNKVEFSPKSDKIMLRLRDGSLAFWAAGTGEDLLHFYPIDYADWVVIHPSGLFDASPNTMKLMYYELGREIVELEQLKERYYEPGLFEKAMFQDESLRDVESFETVMMYPQVESRIESDSLHIQLQKRNGGIGKVSIFINSKEVIPDANANRDTALIINLSRFEKYYLRDTASTISIRVYNAAGWLKSSAIEHSYTPKVVGQKGELLDAYQGVPYVSDPHFYAIVVGTSDYAGDQLDLKFADKDSKDIASAIEQSATLLFGADKTEVHWFSSTGIENSLPSSKAAIKKVVDSIAMKAKPEDVLLFYFSGHGVTYGTRFEDEQFYYLTKDLRSGDLTDPGIRNSYAISSNEMTEWINDIAAQKQIMILDACSSGKLVEDLLAVRDIPTSQIRALDRMKDRTGMFVIAGSAADKVSYEASQFGQGLLTYSLLLGMSGAALKDGQSVDVMTLFQFARDQVPEFANDIGGVQTPTLAFPTDASSFDIGIVNDQVNIPLQKIKPLFTRSNFQEERSFRDVINLSKALDDFLVNASSGPASRGVIFVDVNEFENAYSINGRYRVEGDEVTLEGRLFRGKEKLGDINVTGDTTQSEKLVGDILNKTMLLINSRK